MMAHPNILTSDDDIREAACRRRTTVAVLGIKPDTHAGQPAYYVAQYMAERGYDVIPVPVYYPRGD